LLKTLIKSLNRHAALTLSLCLKGQLKGAAVSFFLPMRISILGKPGVLTIYTFPTGIYGFAV